MRYGLRSLTLSQLRAILRVAGKETAKDIATRGRAVVARRAHNPEVVGSNPTPATKEIKGGRDASLFYFLGLTTILRRKSHTNNPLVSKTILVE